MGRLATVLGADKPAAVTDQLPLCFRGGPVAPTIALGTDTAKPPLDARQQHLIEAMYRGQHASGVDLETAVDKGFAVRQDVFQSIPAEMEQAGRGAITAKGFELSARRNGRLMCGQFSASPRAPTWRGPESSPLLQHIPVALRPAFTQEQNVM